MHKEYHRGDIKSLRIIEYEHQLPLSSAIP